MPNKSLSFSDAAKSILVALIVVTLLFGLFEIAEALWLHELEMEVLHKLYVVRGLFISLVAVILVGWLLVKASNPLLSTKDWTEENPPMKKERESNFNSWFILMRWVAIIIATVLVVIVVKVNAWLPQRVWTPLIASIGALTVLNTAYYFVSRKKILIKYLLPFQAYADLVILTLLLHFSGGIENPLTLMLLIHVFIAGIVLSRRHLFGVTLTAVGLLMIMAAGEATGFFDHYTLNIFPHYEQEGAHVHAAHQPLYVASLIGLMIFIFLLAAYFIDTIMNRIRHDERQLEKFAAQSLEQRQLIEKALETTASGLCVCDNDGEPYWINQTWENWFGNQPIDQVDVSDGSVESVSLAKTLVDGKTRVGELTIGPNGAEDSPRTYLVTTAPLLDKNGNIDRAVSLAADITEQIEARERMLRAGKLAAVGELAGKVAHEINNPIGILSAKCRLLLSDHRDEMSEKVKNELVKITDAADRVSDIAKGLLSYCRPSAATRSKLNIQDPLNSAIAMIEQSAQKSDVKIQKELPDTMPPIEGNADEMQQVFLNLFLNALDAMPDGGTLTISAEVPNESDMLNNRFLTIEVSDTGSGISRQVRDQIFEPFFTTKEEGKGTGLGLSICAGIIRSHEGTIDVESEPEEGTRITIQLPVYTTREEAV
ncbi:MAG: ATP-binding protein [Balneolaceae bacterium]|nr:ATP-binding protein [Balneolaceae bacterium]